MAAQSTSGTKETDRLMAAKATPNTALDTFVTDVRNDFENKLGALVEIPTISMDPERQPDIRRGTTDDKGPALSAMTAALYAAESGTPLNINFIWELEEEIGSPNFEHFIKNNHERLQTDSILVSDTIWISRKRPAIPYGLRGM